MADEKKKGPARVAAFKELPENLIIIGIDAGDESHALWDRRILLPIDAELKATIALKGVIEPVVCRADGDKFVVVDGRQRVRALREVNKERIAQGGAPMQVAFVVREGTDNDLAGVAAAANIRVEETQLDKAYRVQHMSDVLKMSTKEIAAHFGVSTQAIGQWTKLLRLEPNVQEALQNGKITSTAAQAISRLSAEKQKVAFDTLTATHKKAVKQEKPAAEKKADAAGEGGEAPASEAAANEAGESNGEDAAPDVNTPAAPEPSRPVTARQALTAINDVVGDGDQVAPGKAELKKILKYLNVKSMQEAELNKSKRRKVHPMEGVLRWLTTGDPRACPELANILADIRNRPNAKVAEAGDGEPVTNTESADAGENAESGESTENAAGGAVLAASEALEKVRAQAKARLDEIMGEANSAPAADVGVADVP